MFLTADISDERVSAIYTSCVEKHPDGCWGIWEEVDDDRTLVRCVGCGYKRKRGPVLGEFIHLGDKRKAVESHLTFRTGN